MESANDRGPKWAILYARVSTEEQARSGYSLAQQLEALREYAAQKRYEVLEEVKDPGCSGASLERPGLNRVRKLVAAGGVSVVLAQDRDRVARDPIITGWLQLQFEEYGTKLKALDGPEDDSPTGELTAGILDQIAKFERTMTTQRTRRGRLQRAKEGKVLGSGSPPYGFKYNQDRTNYVVDEATMPVVRRMFQMVAEGHTLHGVKKAFEEEGIPPPGGGEGWYVVSMRRITLNDVYKPHSREQLKGMVSPEVLAKLDLGENYGVWWYGRERVKLTPTGKRRRKWEKNPESDWIAIPVPDAGIPLEMVEAARSAIENSYVPRRPSKRFHELAGMLYCGCCGLRMTGYTTRGYHYYRCQKRSRWGKDAYPDGVLGRAETLERQVMVHIQELISNPEKLRANIDETIAKETLRNPGKEAAAWLRQIEDCKRRRVAYQDQQAAGLMTLDELGAKLRVLEDTRATAEKELARLREGQKRIKELEANKRALLEAYSKGILFGIEWFPAQLRRNIYEMMGLKVTVYKGELDIEAGVNANVVQLTREVEEYAKKALIVRERIAQRVPQEELQAFAATVWRELISRKRTDKVMSVMLNER